MAIFSLGGRYRSLKVNAAISFVGLVWLGYLLSFDSNLSRGLHSDPLSSTAVLFAVDIVCIIGVMLISFNTYQFILSVRNIYPNKINVIVYVFVFSTFIAFALYFFLFDMINSMEEGALTTSIATGYWSSSINPSYEIFALALVIWAIVLPELFSYVVSGLCFGCATRPQLVSWTTTLAVYLLIKLMVAAWAFQLVHGIYELFYGAGQHALWLSCLISSASMMVGVVSLWMQTFVPVFLGERVTCH